MEAVAESQFISVEEYLEGEKIADVRHEYLDGWMVAMAGASRAHNLISGNIFAKLHPHVRGHDCDAFMADMKARLQVLSGEVFYYPDLMVSCDPRDTGEDYCRFPRIIIEVLSKSTDRQDRREKFWSYAGIETMEEYVLVEQSKSEVTVFRRANDWKPEISKLPEDLLRLESVGFQMPLSEVYDRVDFSAGESA